MVYNCMGCVEKVHFTPMLSRVWPQWSTPTLQLFAIDVSAESENEGKQQRELHCCSKGELAGMTFHSVTVALGCILLLRTRHGILEIFQSENRKRPYSRKVCIPTPINPQKATSF